MDREELTEYVRQQIADYRYELPPAGSTFGVPWSVERVNLHLEKLRQSVVRPYLQSFRLRDSVEQIDAPTPHFADYWVVAKDGDSIVFIVFFDPNTGEFGLAEQRGVSTPDTIGVRGDLAGVFMAI